MNKKSKMVLIVLGVLVSIAVIIGAIYFVRINNNTIATITAVVVKVNEKSIEVMGIGNTSSLYSVEFTKEGNIGFKQGQEVLIYFDGMILETYPAQLGKVGKIKIIKEESNTTIPEDVLRFYFSSRNNVSVTVSELTSKGISFKITDTNELPYKYPNDYKIYKKVKNEEYTGIGYPIGEDTTNSIAGYTRKAVLNIYGKK